MSEEESKYWVEGKDHMAEPPASVDEDGWKEDMKAKGWNEAVRAYNMNDRGGPAIEVKEKKMFVVIDPDGKRCTIAYNEDDSQWQAFVAEGEFSVYETREHAERKISDIHYRPYYGYVANQLSIVELK